jgi:hypothetical protein
MVGLPSLTKTTGIYQAPDITVSISNQELMPTRKAVPYVDVFRAILANQAFSKWQSPWRQVCHRCPKDGFP